MTLYAFVQHKQLLSMGLSRLDLEDWLQPDETLAEQVALKQQLWQNQGARVFSALASSLDAQLELAETLADNLSKHYPALYQAEPGGLFCTAINTRHRWADSANPLLTTSWCVQEDLCLLQPIDEQYHLTAASLCAPSYWRLLEKIGQPIDAIHAPVPGFAQQLSKKVNRFLQFIRVENPVWRGNWSVVTSDRLYQPGDEEAVTISDPDQIPVQCFLRTERQTLRRLAQTGAVVFTIRVSIKPLSSFSHAPEILKDLKAALDGLSEPERRYKSLHNIEPALSTWLEDQLNPT